MQCAQARQGRAGPRGARAGPRGEAGHRLRVQTTGTQLRSRVLGSSVGRKHARWAGASLALTWGRPFCLDFLLKESGQMGLVCSSHRGPYSPHPRPAQNRFSNPYREPHSLWKFQTPFWKFLRVGCWQQLKEMGGNGNKEMWG